MLQDLERGLRAGVDPCAPGVSCTESIRYCLSLLIWGYCQPENDFRTKGVAIMVQSIVEEYGAE